MTINLKLAIRGAPVTKIAIVLGLILFTSGCAPTYMYSYPGHKTFTITNIEQLHVGMTGDEVKAIFGSPDEEFDTDFGEDVGEKWTGRMWIYFTEKDPNLKYVNRYKKNIFVFYPPVPKMKLNHWHIEK